ncbi:hypothetical protein Tco_0309935 [Tanacetum coccineum]
METMVRGRGVDEGDDGVGGATAVAAGVAGGQKSAGGGGWNVFLVAVSEWRRGDVYFLLSVMFDDLPQTWLMDVRRLHYLLDKVVQAGMYRDLSLRTIRPLQDPTTATITTITITNGDGMWRVMIFRETISQYKVQQMGEARGKAYAIDGGIWCPLQEHRAVMNMCPSQVSPPRTPGSNEYVPLAGVPSKNTGQ